MEDLGTRFRVWQEQVAGGVRVKASNDWPLAVSCEVTVQGEGVQVTDANNAPMSLKTLHVVPPYSPDVVLCVVRLAPSGGNFSYSSRMALGAANARHDDTVRYRWPFEANKPRMCGQTFGGEISHSSKEIWHSVDFLMPVGTPVLCARRGIVLSTKAHETEGGPDPSFKDKGNFVSVCHSDGSVAHYVHLKHNGVLVQPGQAVKEGDHLGLSGNTGWSTAPHLHFMVTLPAGKPGAAKTVPYRFEGSTAEGCVPCVNQSYPGGASLPLEPEASGVGPAQPAVKAAGVKLVKGVPPKKGIVKKKGAGGPVKVKAKGVPPAGGPANNNNNSSNGSIAPIPAKPAAALPPVNRGAKPQEEYAPPPPPYDYNEYEEEGGEEEEEAGYYGYQQQPDPYAQQQYYQQQPPPPYQQQQQHYPPQQHYAPPPNQQYHQQPPPPGAYGQYNNAPAPPASAVPARVVTPARTQSAGALQAPAPGPAPNRANSSGMLAVPNKPPPVDRSVKPANAPPVQQAYMGSPALPRNSGAYGLYQPPAEPVPEGMNASMMPGTRSAPPSKALHPELYVEHKPVDRTPDGTPVQDSMKPGYVREKDTMEEIKRAIDPRRHNPVTKTKKKAGLAAVGFDASKFRDLGSL